jgi:hypothetical protein
MMMMMDKAASDATAPPKVSGGTRSRSRCKIPVTPSQKSPAGKKTRFNNNSNNTLDNTTVLARALTTTTTTTTIIDANGAVATAAHLITPPPPPPSARNTTTNRVNMDTALSSPPTTTAASLVSIQDYGHHDGGEDDNIIQDPSTDDVEKDTNDADNDDDDDDELEDALIAEMKGLVIHWKDLFRDKEQDEANPGLMNMETMLDHKIPLATEVQKEEVHRLLTMNRHPRDDNDIVDDISSPFIMGMISDNSNTAKHIVDR